MHSLFKNSQSMSVAPPLLSLSPPSPQMLKITPLIIMHQILLHPFVIKFRRCDISEMSAKRFIMSQKFDYIPLVSKVRHIMSLKRLGNVAKTDYIPLFQVRRSTI